MTDSVEIVLKIAGRTLQVELPTDEVDDIKSIVAKVDAAYQDFHRDFPQKDKTDQVIMAFMQVFYKDVKDSQVELKALRLQLDEIATILPSDL
jgi:cell division protein ZapA (FtsZ GTPase activity inhibitor)